MDESYIGKQSKEEQLEKYCKIETRPFLANGSKGSRWHDAVQIEGLGIKNKMWLSRDKIPTHKMYLVNQLTKPCKNRFVIPLRLQLFWL